MRNRLNPRSGISLIETMVALIVLGVIGVTLVRLLLQVESANNSARLRNEAANYAEEGVEQVRGFVQTPGNGWNALNALIGTPCTYYSDGNLTTPCASGMTITTSLGNVIGSPIGVDNLYRSVVLVSDNGAVKVRSIVGWVEKGASKYTEVDTNFYNY